MKFNKKLTAFLSLLLIICTVATLPAFAAEEEEIDYLSIKNASEIEKVESMELILEKNGSQLYIDRVSGEIAFKDTATEQILLSNPYDIASTAGSDNIKNQLMSQLIISYEENGVEKILDSYSAAAVRNQIKVKKTKSGVRVEYIIGEQVTRRLVPYLIEKESFENNILAHMTDDKVALDFSVYYSLKDPWGEGLTDRQLREMRNTWPITEEMAVYVFDPKATSKEKDRFENYIKEYAPSYTFEMLDADHELTKYEGSEKSPPLFRMALEYSIDDDGNLDVRLPANGIRFDETVYSLTNVKILPYFGAGTTEHDGEILIPDGSGAIIRPAQFVGEAITLTNTIYGQDYAYQKVSGAHQEIMHMPVYGVVHNNMIKTEYQVEELDKVEVIDEETGLSSLVEQMVTKTYVEETPSAVGFIAIINEGDSLANITAENGGTLHDYFTAYTAFAPRPKDTYNLSESISIGGNAIHTIVSDRKYTGSYRIKYIMINDAKVAEEKGAKDTYEASWVGMAHAYRDYLEDTGVISPMTKDDGKKDIPLFIESFGSVETTKRIATLPVTVLEELTTFDDLVNMNEKLNEADITNINFKLTGFANGGMVSTVPYKVKFDKSVGGNNGFKEFLEYANEKGILVFPDFDFVYFKKAGNSDGISNKDLVKTMDNRYTSKRYYDSTLQSYEKTTTLAISPKSFERLYDKFTNNYSKFENPSVALSTLGSDLNSDFNKKDPYNREDSKELTKNVFEKASTDYENVLSDSANAYSLGYADYYLNVPLDSSNYLSTSESVPFMGMVLHGYKTFTGTATNMAGDINYQILKSIESGSSIYFVLSAQNTGLLKESEDLNKYYSVGFDIWYDDLVSVYNTVNEALNDCQTATIDDHEFILGERVPTAEEAEDDRLEAEAAAEAKAEADEAKYQKALKRLKLEARRNGQNPETVTLNKEEYLASEEKPVEETEGYVRTKYTTDEGKIAVVTYSNGVKFILNFNSFDVTVKYDGVDYTVKDLGFIKIK